MNSSVEPQNTQNNEEELLNNVLQDIAQTTQKERTLFNKSLSNNQSDEIPNKIMYEEDEPNVEQVHYNNTPSLATPIYNNHTNTTSSSYISPTPMELLKESLKWSVIVAGLVFLFSRPTIINNLAQYLPSKLLVDGGLNTFGAIFVAFLAGFLFFVLFHWIM